MTFANGLARGVAVTAFALGITGVVSAQNGTNYHVLNNNGDAIFLGIGAGATQTPADGIGTFVPGEDCRGSLQVDFGVAGIQFSYRQSHFRENICVLNPGVVSGQVLLEFDGIYFIELAGAAGTAPGANKNVVFLRPVCTTPITASFLQYGLGPSSTVSFVAALTSALGPTQTVWLPDNGLVATTGTATLVGAGTGTLGPVASGCYVVQFFWTPSALPYQDKIDGIWHYAINSADANQYWIMSDDEMNLTRSNTVLGDAGATNLLAFFAVIDYDTHYATREASTLAILANHGIEQNGPYYAQTENMTGGGGPNFGFDAGRGSRAISFSGLGGVKVPPGLGGLGNGAQDPAYGGGAQKTLGFATWDNKANIGTAGVGSGRITWISIDLAQINNLGPQGSPGNPNITKGGGTVRLPVVGTGFIQPVTSQGLTIFQHTTKAATSGWPDPDGIASGAFAVPPIAGGSIQFNVGPFVAKVPCNGSLPINLTYGTTGLNHSPPPALTWDPANADISGSKEIYLWK
jgi:hypothetical protein